MRKMMVSSILSVLVLCVLTITVWASPVPDEIPEDLGGRTFYGYLVDLTNEYLKKGVFTDAAKFSDDDRENARRAANLIIKAVTEENEESGAVSKSTLWVRAIAYENRFLDTKDPDLRDKALADFRLVVEMGDTFAQADFDRVEALEVPAAPLAWQIPQMLTLEEASTLLNDEALQFVTVPFVGDDPNRLGIGYALQEADDPAATTIYVLVDLLGGTERFNDLKRTAYLHEAEALATIGDAAYVMNTRNSFNDPMRHRTIVALKDDLLIQVRVPVRAWQQAHPDFDPEQIANDFTIALLDNLFDTERTIPSLAGIEFAAIKPLLEMPVPEGNTSFPDGWPEDLGGRTPYGHLIDLRERYVPGAIFVSEDYDQQSRDDARQAMRIIVNRINDEFAESGPNEYNLEIRAYCYFLAFQDSGNPVFRHLAVNDYKHALDLGYTYARADYRLLTQPLLEGMANGIEKGDETYIAHLKEWLMAAELLTEPESGDAMIDAIKTLEEVLAFEVDGIADIDLLLALYARVDDDDWLFFDD